MELDTVRVRRESLRWLIVLALNNARPAGAYESVILAIVQSVYPDATLHELRVQLDYLRERELLKLIKEPAGRWHAGLTRLGVDLAEYTIDCQPGIARPAKYW